MRRTLLVFVAAVIAAAAADAPPFRTGKGWKPLLNGTDMSGWTGENNKPHDWITATDVRYDAETSPKTLTATPAPGGIILNSLKGRTNNIYTTTEHGDVELYVEFMVPKGSNSGVYLQGLYEIQVFDSFGKEKVCTSYCGSIYHLCIDEKPV